LECHEEASGCITIICAQRNILFAHVIGVANDSTSAEYASPVIIGSSFLMSRPGFSLDLADS
jgi:hypothetical protein